MWLPWKAAVVLAIVLAIGVLLARGSRRHPVAVAVAFARETAIVLVLYALWRLAGTLSVMKVTHALSRGQAIWDFERRIHLPSEAWVQRAALSHPLVVQAANRYYMIAHVPALGILLVWLFVCHRARYPHFRNAIAALTGLSLAIQLLPVAPPRMLFGVGLVDTAQLYHQSVYSALGSGAADQLSAMPSVHVGWAVVIGVAAVQVSRSRWRWLVLAHPVATVLVVVITANHYWMDGIVEVAVLAAILAVQQGGSHVVTTWRARAVLAAEPSRSDVGLAG